MIGPGPHCRGPQNPGPDSPGPRALALTAVAPRALSVEAPHYWSVRDWCRGFRDLLDTLGLEKVHLLGAALGGFLAQKFVEFTRPCPRCCSSWPALFSGS